MSLLSRDAIEVVVNEFIEQRIVPMMEAGHVKRSHCHIVIVDPTAIYREDMSDEEAFAYQRSVNIYGKPFDYPYDQIARSKARISFRTGMTTREVIELAPHKLREGDTVYPGSAVVYGLIVAISGWDDWDDESLSNQLAWELWRRAKVHYALQRGRDLDFVTTFAAS